jgi:hypothetical protein
MSNRFLLDTKTINYLKRKNYWFVPLFELNSEIVEYIDKANDLNKLRDSINNYLKYHVHAPFSSIHITEHIDFLQIKPQNLLSLIGISNLLKVYSSDTLLYSVDENDPCIEYLRKTGEKSEIKFKITNSDEMYLLEYDTHRRDADYIPLSEIFTKITKKPIMIEISMSIKQDYYNLMFPDF